MAITTKISPVYAVQKIFAVLLCAVFGLWGAYDYVYKIPRQQATFERYEQLNSELEQLDKSQAQHSQRGTLPTEAERQHYTQVTSELNALAPGGKSPSNPSKFNRVTQWIYMACLPFSFWFVWMYIKARRQSYRLDDDGSLHFQGDPELGSGTWTRDQITDIDMSRWMAKSIATAVRNDGTRLKLDAYLHKDLHLIIGAIASRFYPDKWDREAKEIKNLEDLAEELSASESTRTADRAVE